MNLQLQNIAVSALARQGDDLIQNGRIQMVRRDGVYVIQTLSILAPAGIGGVIAEIRRAMTTRILQQAMGYLDPATLTDRSGYAVVRLKPEDFA